LLGVRVEHRPPHKNVNVAPCMTKYPRAVDITHRDVCSYMNGMQSRFTLHAFYIILGKYSLAAKLVCKYTKDRQRAGVHGRARGD